LSLNQWRVNHEWVFVTSSMFIEGGKDDVRSEFGMDGKLICFVTDIQLAKLAPL